MSEIKSFDILKSVRSFFINYEYKLFNSYLYAWECDFFAISSSGYAVEVEVKVSRSDFFADFKKEEKHRLFNNHKKTVIVESKYPFQPFLRRRQELSIDGEFMIGDHSQVYFCNPANRLPNKFYYAVPRDLISLAEVPPYAGLFYYQGGMLTEVKRAPFLHKVINDKKDTLLQKYYWMDKNFKGRIFDLSNDLIQHLDERGREKLKNFMSKIHF